MKIEILGPGCERCRAVEANVRKAVGESGLTAEIVHVTDLREIARRGVLLTPALALDGRVKASGRVPMESEIRRWLTENAPLSTKE